MLELLQKLKCEKCGSSLRDHGARETDDGLELVCVNCHSVVLTVQFPEEPEMTCERCDAELVRTEIETTVVRKLDETESFPA